MFDQTMNISSTFELSFLICSLINAKNIYKDFLSVNANVENWNAIFSNSLDVWKLRRKFVVSNKNCLMILRTRLLSMI